MRNSFDEEEEDDTEFLREKVSNLTAENSNLREQLDQSNNDLGFLKSQAVNPADHLDSIREMLREREPNLERLLEEALRMERQRQEQKD